MSKRQFLCVLGVWVMIFLFLGLPSDWDRVVGVVSGLVIVIAAYTLPAPLRDSGVKESKETFTENKQP
jgi:type IV secretory pathway VirB2 component (pilin)